MYWTGLNPGGRKGTVTGELTSARRQRGGGVEGMLGQKVIQLFYIGAADVTSLEETMLSKHKQKTHGRFMNRTPNA